MNDIVSLTDFTLRDKSFSKQKPINDILSEIIGEKWVEYRARWNKASAREVVTEFPLFVLFEDQYACNLKCKMCIHGDKDFKKKYSYKGKLSLEKYRSLIDECAAHNCPSICMNNINEPLLEEDIFERIGYARQKGILDIHMNTNATLLTREKSKLLLEAGLTRLLIGFDGYGKEEYEKMRVGADYDEVMGNVNAFLDLRAKMGMKLPVVRISLVHTKENSQHLDEFTNYWLGKVDYVSIQKFEPFDTSKSEKLHPDDIKKNRPANICNAMWERVTIQGDGNVIPCCHMTARELSMGNVHESSIYEIWNSEKMKNLRKKHETMDIADLPVCVSCLAR